METTPGAAPSASVSAMVHAPAPHVPDVLATRRTWYQQHLVAAQFFADTAATACAAEGASLDRTAMRAVRDLVTASILSAAAYLEVSVNELFIELRDGRGVARPQSRRLMVRFAREWLLNDKASALERYQRLLAHFDGDQFHPRRTPYLEVERLIRWRDELLVRAGGAPLRLEGAVLLASRHDVPSLTPSSLAHKPAHPGRLRLVPATAQWGVQSAVRFSAEFCRRMRLPNRE